MSETVIVSKVRYESLLETERLYADLMMGRERMSQGIKSEDDLDGDDSD